MRVGLELTVTNFHLRCSTGNTVWIWIFTVSCLPQKEEGGREEGGAVAWEPANLAADGVAPLGSTDPESVSEDRWTGARPKSGAANATRPRLAS